MLDFTEMLEAAQRSQILISPKFSTHSRSCINLAAQSICLRRVIATHGVAMGLGGNAHLKSHQEPGNIPKK